MISIGDRVSVYYSQQRYIGIFRGPLIEEDMDLVKVTLSNDPTDFIVVHRKQCRKLVKKRVRKRKFWIDLDSLEASGGSFVYVAYKANPPSSGKTERFLETEEK